MCIVYIGVLYIIARTKLNAQYPRATGGHRPQIVKQAQPHSAHFRPEQMQETPAKCRQSGAQKNAFIASSCVVPYKKPITRHHWKHGQHVTNRQCSHCHRLSSAGFGLRQQLKKGVLNSCRFVEYRCTRQIIAKRSEMTPTTTAQMTSHQLVEHVK
jgi:hypothetical protein